jgi:hypothetical protein
VSVAAGFLWRFLDDVWDLLPTEDRKLFEAYWSGKLQVAANLEQRVLELAQAREISEIPVFLTERWNSFAMNEGTIDQFSATEALTLVATTSAKLARETAFYDTLVVSSPSGQIHHQETMRFFDASVRQLRYGKIVPGTVSVTLEGFEFTPNRDYVVNHETGAIQALDNGRILPTDLVTITYQHREYTRDLDYVVDEVLASVARTSDSTIPSGGSVSVSYTYNNTATLHLEGSRGSVTLTTLTDSSKDFGALVPGRTLTVKEGPNAGTYTIGTVLDRDTVQITSSFPTVQETDVVYSINAFPHGIKIDKQIVSIPTLQNLIDNPTVVMVEGIDYLVRDGILAVRAAFPMSQLGSTETRRRRMWAEVSKVNHETPYRNFGVLIDFFRENSEEYKLALQGLWYTFWTGSSPGNLQRGLHILLGLPFARRTGTVTRVDAGQIDITDPRGQTITYQIPLTLEAVVAAGDEVTRFDSLTSGVRIIDRNNEPGFVRARLGRAGVERFLTTKATRGEGDTDETKALDLLEHHLFIPQVLVDAITQHINVRELTTFLNNMKPEWTEYVFSFTLDSEDTLVLEEEIGDPEGAINVSTTVGNNEWNQSFQFENFLAQATTGEIINAGTQATGNFRDSQVNFTSLGVDEDDVIIINSGLFRGHHRVLRRINNSTLALDIPDDAIIETINIDYVAVPAERLMDHDVIAMRRDNISLAGTTYTAPSGLNTKTDIDFASLSLNDEEAKSLLLVDVGIAAAPVQAIIDADLVNQEIEVGTPPTPAVRDHQIASCALVRTEDGSVTDAFAI